MKTKNHDTEKALYVGYDIGSESIHAVVLDDQAQMVYAPQSLTHYGNPLDALKECHETILEACGTQFIKAYGFTGTGGKLIADMTGNPYFYDTITIPLGAQVIAPEGEYIIHIGARDPYFFDREIVRPDVQSGITPALGSTGEKAFISDHGTGTKCGGGSGILINKQLRRFFCESVPLRLEDPNSATDGPSQFALTKRNRQALQNQDRAIQDLARETVSLADKNLNVGGRCGVIIHSDMIHMQNSGEQIKNILMGMYIRIARNYKSDVLGTRSIQPQKRAIATGGVFLNSLLPQLFSKELGISLTRPENGEKIAAAGAALKVWELGIESSFSTHNLRTIREAGKQEITFAPPLSSALHRVKNYPETERITQTPGGLSIFHHVNEPIPVVLGIDGGSTTTKAIIAHADSLEIIAEICRDTDGKPLEMAQNIFAEIGQHLGDKLQLQGIAYTGSSGQFYHRLFTDFSLPDGGVDLVKDEITCHARGVKHFNSRVDTIFECGGQDAKFTVFNQDGTVKKAKMNLSCMAGTGQSMKNMLDMLGFSFQSFQEQALGAKRTPVTDEMCAIFTEAGVLKLLSLNFPREEIAAAIAYGFMGGYANKFVGSETFGSFASAQGGPFKNVACLAALALHTGMEVHGFPHRQLFGALGAALVAYHEVQSVKKQGLIPQPRFRGFEIAHVHFQKTVEDCSTIRKDTCGVRDCKLQVYQLGTSQIFSGGLCPKGNTASLAKPAPDYVTRYKKRPNAELAKYSILPNDTQQHDQPRILIPRTLHFLNQRGVFFTSLFHELGFKVVVSPETDDSISDLGIANSHSEACFPSKLQHGHTAFLKQFLRPGIDKMFLVNMLGQGECGAPQNQSKTCPFVSGAGFSAKEAVKIETRDALLPLIFFNDDIYKLEDDLWADFKRAFKDTPTPQPITRYGFNTAVQTALDRQNSFNQSIYQEGATLVEQVKSKGEKVFIGIGRGYTLFDDKASSRVHDLFVANGLHFIPAFYLEQPKVDIDSIFPHMYWLQGREMARYNIMTALDPDFYGVRETNFNCGPDAMLTYHENELFNKADKPYLTLQTDGHNSNAQFGTRAMANYEVVKNHIPRKLELKDLEIPEYGEESLKNRILGIPDMGTESSQAVAAVFQSVGVQAEVMPTKTTESNYYSRKYLITNNCLPMHILFGDCMAWIHQKQREEMDPNRELALFIPMAGGPCRLGQYHIITRQFLVQSGFHKVLIVKPAAYLDWENLPLPAKERGQIRKGLAKASIFGDILYNARLRTRPYERNPGETDRVVGQIHQELLTLIASGSDFKAMKNLMHQAAQRIQAIPVSNVRYPKVGMFGEIYVRSHPGSNEDSIRKLEGHKLEIVPRLTADMLEYNNKMQTAAFLKERRYSSWLLSLMKGLYMHKVEKAFMAPFSEYLKDREQKRPIEIYNLLRKKNIFDIRIKGEAGISIGVSYMFMNDNPEDLHGVYHLEPFGCMQECVATSKIRSLIDLQRGKESDPGKKLIPYMVGVFGDSELPNLDGEMAMFAEKCYARRELTRV